MILCRVCQGSDFECVVDLGEMAFSGIFPPRSDPTVPTGSLTVLLCKSCGLAQLGDSFAPDILYGPTYGYRSGLNRSMVAHLQNVAKSVSRFVSLNESDSVLDIGANDGTLLRSYEISPSVRIAIDPTVENFSEFYLGDTNTIRLAEFFDPSHYWAVSSKPAKIVTSVAMFYDLEDPLAFARGVEEILDANGVWFLEQSYAPWMLRSGAYDTICHEHLEYYSLTDMQNILSEAGFEIADVSTNQVNGGSFALFAVKAGQGFRQSETVKWALEREKRLGSNSLPRWQDFANRVQTHTHDFRTLLENLKSSGKQIKGLGASTKGNVLLQACGIGSDLITEIGEINDNKVGRLTPGTKIPIVREGDLLDSQPDYIVVFPWHFREGFLEKCTTFLSAGGKLILPLPDIEIIGLG